MRLTQITVSYGETQSLPEYSNVKPNLTLTATIEPEDDPTQIEFELWAWARDSVHAQIDQALEASGKAARYSTEPRFQIVRTYYDRYGRDRGKSEADSPKLVAILPNELDARDIFGEQFVHAVYPESRMLRLAHARRATAEWMANEKGYTLIDCSDGNLEPLRAALGTPESNPDYAPTPESEF